MTPSVWQNGRESVRIRHKKKHIKTQLKTSSYIKIASVKFYS